MRRRGAGRLTRSPACWPAGRRARRLLLAFAPLPRSTSPACRRRPRRRSLALWRHEYRELRSAPPRDWPRLWQEWALQHDSYIVDFDSPLPDEEDWRLTDGTEPPACPCGEISFSAFMYGNATAIANDPLPDPLAHPDA